MYLEKLEIQGFKSFANKNVLVFPGMLGETKRGITAVVGPNGCGKSNIADSVRWVLGEQSMKTLRGKKSEDVIFSGSDKKGQLGMAEVSMYLNNESRQAPIDYSEIVISRRLFRNGDSEYLINNSRARLSDIQMLLARSKFGQRTYSVIGQGMVEGFLNTSLSERKEFFDEATGVKQYQIKRDDSLNKLKSSYENLNQTSMLLVEIEPRLKSLTRQVNKLHKRGEIEGELKTLQKRYYSFLWHDIHAMFREHNERYLDLEKQKMEKDKRIENLSRELGQMEEESGKNDEYLVLQDKLNKSQVKKDELTRQIAKLEAALELKYEASGQFDLSWLHAKGQELKTEIDNIGGEIEVLGNNIAPEKDKLKTLGDKLKDMEYSIKSLNEKLIASSSIISEDDLGEIQKLSEETLSAIDTAQQENDLDAMKGLIAKLKSRMARILDLASKKSGKKSGEEMHEQLKKLNEAKEQVLLEINDTNLRISARTERAKLLKEKEAGLKNELESVKVKIAKSENGKTAETDPKERERLQQALEAINNEITKTKNEISGISAQEESKRARLFELQKSIQSTQEDINTFNSELGQIKINSTRYETRLEGLEIEIRHDYGDLKEIREYKSEEPVDVDASRDKIDSLKRQLDQIGGIDPEIENEYNETKERFDFLSGQVNDLNQAIHSLEKVIKELDGTIREQFDKEFNIIAKKFNEYFKILFNGGNAKIIKVMENEKEEAEPEDNSEVNEETEDEKKKKQKDDDKNVLVDMKKIKFLQKHNATGLAGIEIQAVPPGKKIRSVSMLSGGERAMTAIAMICAIISANPSPFVILDEVDAALDEANSERLAKILDDLSHRTQFILITHNRASMRKANILYGVTMGDDGVSKLLSIKLEEAAEVVKN